VTHFKGLHLTSPPPASLFKPSEGTAGLDLVHVLGFNTDGCQTVLWHASAAAYVAAAGAVAVVEDLESQTQRVFVGHAETITTLALTHDGTLLATAASPPPTHGSHAAIWLWDMRAGRIKHELPPFHVAPVQCLCFSHDDRLLASAGNFHDSALAVWDTHAGTLLATVGLPGPVHALAWDPTRFNALAAVGERQRLYLISQAEDLGERADMAVDIIDGGVATGARHRRDAGSADGHFPGRVGSLTCLAYAAGTGAAAVVLLTGDDEGTLAAWEPHTGRCLASWLADDAGLTRIHVAGRTLMTASAAGSLKLWALDLSGDGALQLDGELDVSGAVTSSSMDAVLALGLVSTSEGVSYMVHWGEAAAVPLASTHVGAIRGLDVSRDGTYLATGGDDGSVRVWHAEDREQVLCFQVAAPDDGRNTRACTSVAFSADGSRCAAGFISGALRIFDLDRVELETKVIPHTSAVTEVAFSADGRVLLSGAQDGVVVVSSATTGSTLHTLRDHRGSRITALDVGASPPPPGLLGKELWLACSADRQISVWDADWRRDFNQVLDWLSLPGDGVQQNKDGLEDATPTLARFSVTDPAIILCTAAGPQPAVLFYSLHRREVLRNVRLERPAYSLSVSPSGDLIAVGTYDRLVRLIDYATCKLVEKGAGGGLGNRQKLAGRGRRKKRFNSTFAPTPM
jgi:WD40 repeat protein